ncbi:MAG: 3-hydroxyacyl-CoA dehydrogenase [Paucibacter sp.]|nr:3-hydroxyacyl-CoA dehydrogenase [Roseateles sp.]
MKIASLDAGQASAPIGVVGAGVMGAGIAQVAAQAGHEVWLLDARSGAAAAAVAKIGEQLATLVAKGRMTAEVREGVLTRLHAAERIESLADCALVIEAIVELAEPKQALLRELDGLLGAEALIATNTSSISVTLLANGMARPERLVGMHFFNPVPLMKLVEVVSGAETAPAAAEAVEQLARRWGKTPVHARSTPGFIVNRIARPFYAETLALLQEQAGTPAELDRALRGAGFRMGPCELMDLIGHDTNALVTRSVFEANFGDRRYQPSMVQQALVDGGRLGRKVGRGFYDGVPAPAEPVAAPVAVPAALALVGTGPMVDRLGRWLATRGLAFARDAGDWQGLRADGVEIHLTRGRCAAELAHGRGVSELAVMDWPVEPERAAGNQGVALAFAPHCTAASRAGVEALWRALGWMPLVLRDVPGLAVARTVTMLVNEAADAVWQGVCTSDAADAAMKLGVNYPSGPFEWLAQLGAASIVELLDALFEAYRGERYRVSPLLRQQLWG